MHQGRLGAKAVQKRGETARQGLHIRRHRSKISRNKAKSKYSTKAVYRVKKDMTPPPTAPSARAAAAELCRIGAVQVNAETPFRLTSGRLSPVYVDCRRIISFPESRRILLDLAESLLADVAFDMIAGGESAGIPFAAMLAERLNLPMVYVRKSAKEFGKGRRIEGQIRAGAKTLLVEDMMTDGGSKKLFIDALREEEMVCEDLFVFFRYGSFPKGEAELRAEGVNIHALACWEDIFAVCDLDDGAVNTAREFLANPDGWSAE